MSTHGTTEGQPMSIEPAEHCGHLCCDIPNAPFHDHFLEPEQCGQCQRALALDADLESKRTALRKDTPT